MSGRDRLSRQSLDGSVIRSSQRQPEVSQLSQPQEDGLLYRRSLSRRSANPNVFSDDFSVEPLGAEEAHGFHRISMASSLGIHSTTPPSPINDPETPSNPFDDNSRSSLDEIRLQRSSVQKDADIPNRHSSVTTTSSAQRTPRAMSLYGGATAPSHPYAMYPQIGIGRSGSVTTTSTVRPADAPLQEPTAPQHPYGLYPQNIALEDGVDGNPIPVGFPGHNPSYQGESAQPDDVGDIVGPDGHLEQLPPYSRYPMGMGPKDDASTASLVSLRRDQDLQENEERRAPSVGSSNTLVDANSVTRLTSGTATSLEEKLKKKSRQKVCCGVPIWLLVLTGMVMLLGACLGGVIGGVLGARKAEQTAKATNNVVTVTYTSDAAPMSTPPTGLPPLPTGQFQVPGISQTTSRSCIQNRAYSLTWACQNQGLILDVHNWTITNWTATFEPPSINTANFTYGPQAPFMPSPSRLEFVHDKGDMNLGPALFFCTQFDKLVIIPEREFPPQMKRDFLPPPSPLPGPPPDGPPPDRLGPPPGGPRGPGPGTWNHKQVAAGDKPWFCWWNGTNMEVFIFVNQTSRNATPSSSSFTSSFTSELTSSPSSPLPGYSKRDQPTENYPLPLKIEEKRLPDAPRPYCVQMEVNNGGDIGGPISQPVYIEELPLPVTVTAEKRDTPGSLTLAARASYESPCFCEGYA